MAATRHILEDTADLALACPGAEDVLACKFLMLSTCPVLLPHAADAPDSARLRIELPAHEARDVRIAVDAIHGIARVRDMPLDDIERCARAFDFLGCTIMRDSLTRALWAALRDEPLDDAWFRNAQRFLDAPKFRQQFVQGFCEKTTRFEDVQRLLASAEISHDSSRTLVAHLSTVFPVLRVYFEVLEAFPRALLTEAIAMDILSIDQLHAQFHPEEFSMAVRRVMHKFPDGSPSLKSYIGANQMYDAAPVPSSLTATVLTYRKPRTSVLVKMYNPVRGVKTIHIKNWCRIAVDATAGTLAGRFSLTRLHRSDGVQFGSSCRVRVTTMCLLRENKHDIIDDDLAMQESWATHADLDETYWVDFAPEMSEPLREALRSPLLRYARLDFFYA